MKKFRNLLAALLAGVLSLSMIACSGGGSDETQSSAAGSTAPAAEESTDGNPDSTADDDPATSPDPADPALPVSLTISGVPLESYTIVYANHLYNSRTVRTLFTDYDFYKIIADHMVEEIAAQTGVTLKTARDTKTDPTDYEILVGPTNRAESDLFKTMDVYNYSCRVDGTKLVVGGGYDATKMTGNLRTSYCYASTYHAWDYVKDYVAENAVNGSVDLGSSFALSGTAPITTVACIGDSITEGAGSTDRNFNAYPAVLQRILWQDHLILNYGNSGKTMRDDLDRRYKGTPQYNAAKRYAAKFDATLIMLGTNDSFADTSWTESDDAAFNRSALELAEMLTKSNDDLKLVIMNCPAYYGNSGSASPRIRWLQAGLVSLFTEAGYDTSFYNMRKYTAENLGSARFPDQLHPDDMGYYLMAQGLAEMIPDLISGSWECEPEFPEDGKPAAPPTDVEIPEGSINLLPMDLEESYPIEKGGYSSWLMGGAPYVFKNTPNISGSVVTNIEFPVASVKKGGKFTISVVKYSYPSITETLSTHTLTVDFDAGSGWLKFGGLNIEVPEGYMLAFGAPSDTIVPLFLSRAISGYNFYGVPNKSNNDNAALAFNVYGKKI